ncbi:MAG TPA: tetratricopeptide repeat protein [Candidatus Acidoferrum sp.]|nr:tetratricopeptide repeat protein [Candidatus Acidoferrum sp.]
MICSMRAGFRDTSLIAILFLQAIVSIEFVPGAVAHQDSAPPVRQETAKGRRADYAAAAEAFQKELERAPGSVELWTKWADFNLERFRVLNLELRSLQSGMAVVLRLEAEGLHSGPETREELLRQSATADPEQRGIWGELGVEQVRRAEEAANREIGVPRMQDAAATLKMAQERQPKDLWTLQLEAMMSAARGDWPGAEKRLLELGGRSPREFGKAGQNWPKNLVPRARVGIWQCVGTGTSDCPIKIAFPEDRVAKTEEQLFTEERWERLAALPQPPLEVPAAWFRRGVALAELNDCGGAIPALERGLDAGAETAAYWLELCYASEAERAVAKLGALGNQAAFHRVRGDFLVRVKGDMQAATVEYVKARKLQPRDPLLAERLAQAYENIGDMLRSKKAAREALALDPRRAVSLRLLASIAMNERDYANALESLNKLLALRPNDAWARVQLGIAYAQSGQPQEALANLQPALAAGYPDERGALHAMLASVLRKLGREQEAQSAATESTRLSNLFQQHGQGPTTPPEERPREPR